MAATQDALSELHEQVAQSLSAALAVNETARELLQMYGDDLPDPVATFMRTLVGTSPSLITAATKFLKDNNISCEESTTSAAIDLKGRLRAKKEQARGIGPALVRDLPFDA